MKYVEEVSISIHALLAESDSLDGAIVDLTIDISIHALLAESDPCAWYAPAGAHISIHALLAESDTDRMFCSRQRLNFYPRSPCGERPSAAAPIKLTRSISIHALLAESDKHRQQRGADLAISIHALLAESDQRLKKLTLKTQIFLSTLSLRRATYRLLQCRLCFVFLSTLSLRRATFLCMFKHHSFDISIHALLAESDNTRSRGTASSAISIHALLAESDYVDSAPAGHLT